MAQATLITGVERRRYFSREQKLALMHEAFGVGGSVSQVCRRKDICASLPYRWRQSALAKADGSLIKALWHDGIELSLYAKRLERGRFIWHQAKDGVVPVTLGQMSYLMEGIDWRNLQATWRPKRAS